MVNSENDNENSVLNQLTDCLNRIDKTENLYIAADDLKRFNTTMLMILTPPYLKKEDAKGLQQLLNDDNANQSEYKIFAKRKALQDSKEKILTYIDEISHHKNPKDEHIIDSMYTINSAETTLNELAESGYLDSQLNIHNTYNLIKKFSTFIADEKLAEHREMLATQTGKKFRTPMGEAKAKPKETTPVQQPIIMPNKPETTPVRQLHGRTVNKPETTPVRQPMGVPNKPERLLCDNLWAYQINQHNSCATTYG